MNKNKTTMTTLADALESLAGVLRELESAPPPPSSPESASVGLPDSVGVKYARVATLARRYDFTTVQGILPILKKGVDEGAIRKLGGRGANGERGAVALFNVEDVDAYFEKIRGNAS